MTARFHSPDTTDLGPTWVHVSVAASQALDSLTSDTLNTPENTDTVPEDRDAMREVEGAREDEDAE